MSFKIDNVGNLDRKNIVDDNVKIDISELNTQDARDGLKKLLKFFDKADGVEDGILGKTALDKLQKKVGKKIDHKKLASALNDCFKKAALVEEVEKFIKEIPERKKGIYITKHAEIQTFHKDIDLDKIRKDLEKIIDLPDGKPKKTKRRK